MAPRVLVVATKPPWPATGGGSLATGLLVEALAAAGVPVRVVALARAGATADDTLRLVRARPRSWVRAAGLRLLGRPAVVSRYALPALAAAVAEEVARFRPDVAHLEQIHLGWLLPLLPSHVATVLRQQNIESELLRRLARLAPPPLAVSLRIEAEALARFEAAACRRADLVAAISERDAAGLRRAAPGARVEVLGPVAPPVAVHERERLAGEPPFVALGSFDWWPNREGGAWLLREIWPRVRAALPGALLHLAGPGSASIGRGADGVVHRGFVARPASLYDPRATVLIAVRAASGVRMRLLEAWAAGVPAVSTPAGVAGLVESEPAGVAVAGDAAGLAAAAVRVARDEALRAALVAVGSERLAAFAPSLIARRAVVLYEAAVRARRGARGA